MDEILEELKQKATDVWWAGYYQGEEDQAPMIKNLTAQRDKAQDELASVKKELSVKKAGSAILALPWLETLAELKKYREEFVTPEDCRKFKEEYVWAKGQVHEIMNKVRDEQRGCLAAHRKTIYDLLEGVEEVLNG